MPVMFLSDLEAASYGRYGDSVPQADLERFFYLDDAGQALVAGLRGDHNRLGFSVQLTTARYIGRFLADPLEGVPAEVIDYLAGQLQIADLVVVADLLGHARLDTVRAYTRPTEDDRTKALNLFPTDR